ncbi:MAG: hypothetical protein HGA45_26870 [Chloroflexales bacterium]|nr:hypothetical protein [Chloroflexales bacterium]
MAKPLVTAELVAEAAEGLLARGEEATIITVQQAIGGGSYTTVKKHLDAWKTQRAAAAPVEPPAEIEAQARLLARAVWGLALSHAEQQSAQVREDAERRIEELRAALTTAEAVISRQELESEAQGKALEEARARADEARAHAESARRAAQVAEARAAELERECDTARTQAEAAQAMIITQARELGELDALRRQVAEQAHMLERLASRPGNPS